MIAHTGIITGIVIHDFPYLDLGNHKMESVTFQAKTSVVHTSDFAWLITCITYLEYYSKLKFSVVIVMSNYSCKFGLYMSFSTVVLKH